MEQGVEDNDENIPMEKKLATQFHKHANMALEEEDVFINPLHAFSSFSLKRKRRKSAASNNSQEYDNKSLCSLSSLDSLSSNGSGNSSKDRRRRSLARVVSLAHMVSPAKPVKMIGKTLQKSLSLRNLNQNALPEHSAAYVKPQPCSPYRKPAATPTKRRPSKLWTDTVQGADVNLTLKQVKRQEAIFELCQGEEDLLEDLKLAKTTYHDSMRQLKIMSEEELTCIFGRLETLLPLHAELLEKLQNLRDEKTHIIEGVGQAVLEWLPGISCYVDYCANQVYAKSLLDEKQSDKRVGDFLQRCIESPFSRKLDLWSFLDVPRSRLVKYPLLLKTILKYTPEGHEDEELLHKAISGFEKVISEVDVRTGESKCQFVIDRLYFPHHNELEHSLINNSRYLACAGELRNTRGTKIDVFLFEKILVVTRRITRCERTFYQVQRHSIPVSDLQFEDINEKGGGLRRASFRRSLTSLSQGVATRYMFRTYSKHDPTHGHTFETSDEHNKRQWTQCLRSIVPTSDNDDKHSIVATNNKVDHPVVFLSNSDDTDNKHIVETSDQPIGSSIPKKRASSDDIVEGGKKQKIEDTTTFQEQRGDGTSVLRGSTGTLDQPEEPDVEQRTSDSPQPDKRDNTKISPDMIRPTSNHCTGRKTPLSGDVEEANVKGKPVPKKRSRVRLTLEDHVNNEKPTTLPSKRRCQQNTSDDEGVQNENVLAFKKGDHFEVLENEEDRRHKQWWIARALHGEGEAVGFVPAKYLKPEHKKVAKLLPEDSRSRELNKKALEELKQRSHNPLEQVYPELLIPEPDYYSDEETGSPYDSVPSGDGGHLIRPKKLPNPCLESSDRQQLHRELKLNQKIGRNVLNQKSELKKELEKRQDNASRKQELEQKRENRSSFEVRMEQQAAKLKMAENAAEMERQRIEEEEKHKPEFVKVKERIKGRTESPNSDS